MPVPKKDTDLIAFGSNFDEKVTLSPVTYGLVAAQALLFHTKYGLYADAFAEVEAARAAGTRSKFLTADKESKKLDFLVVARELYGYVQDNPNVSVANKLEIGVNPKNKLPSPIPAPDEAPKVDIMSVIGRTVAIHVHEIDSARKGRPPGTSGAIVMSFVGAEPPTAGTEDWKFEGNISLTSTSVVFPATVAAGAQVWITACWFNDRKQQGPWATPVSTNIAGTIAA